VYREDIFDLIDRLARAERTSISNNFLDEFLRATGLANVAYVAFNLPTRSPQRPLLSAAYAPSWRKSYAQSRRVDIEPILRVGLGGIAPVDWRLLDCGDPIIIKLLGEALELDVGANGVSIPVRGREGEYALFSACLPERASRTSRQTLMRRLMVVSAIFHSKVREACEAKGPYADARLSDCELTCLRLKALKKSDDEIGLILGASANTARFWLETARARLNAVTLNQAVEKALRLGLIRGDEKPLRPEFGSFPIAGPRSMERRER
jgi:DNA-binding CsgD family transcriptional regulator